MPMILALKETKMMFKGCDAFLACVVTSSGNPTVVQDVPVVRNYLDVFPDELLELPPHRVIDSKLD